MAKHRRPSADDTSIGEEVAEIPAYWSVDDGHWPLVSPTLPDDMVDLLAPPIVVGVARVPVTSRATPPGKRPARPAGLGDRPGVTVPGPAGRHRSGTVVVDWN
ncbi:hypothetical protein [Micromonospora psammae]|uniref:hypothetical protein n=1 Tax=Micromonospora sp. CPCC 205556 TaxID=3122398 RepID=UPI002FEFE7A3